MKPVLLNGLLWTQAHASLLAVDCAIRRPHWCNPVVILKDGKLVIDDGDEIKPFGFMPGDRMADDWMMVPRLDDEGNDVTPDYRRPT